MEAQHSEIATYDCIRFMGFDALGVAIWGDGYGDPTPIVTAPAWLPVIAGPPGRPVAAGLLYKAAGMLMVGVGNGGSPTIIPMGNWIRRDSAGGLTSIDHNTFMSNYMPAGGPPTT
jgi:hypothetical protein